MHFGQVSSLTKRPAYKSPTEDGEIDCQVGDMYAVDDERSLLWLICTLSMDERIGAADLHAGSLGRGAEWDGAMCGGRLDRVKIVLATHALR